MTLRPFRVAAELSSPTLRIVVLLAACQLVSLAACLYLMMGPGMLAPGLPLRHVIYLLPTLAPLCSAGLIWGRLRGSGYKPDIEGQQAVVRTVNVAVVLVYFCVRLTVLGDDSTATEAWIGIGYYNVAWPFLALILRYPGTGLARRVAGMIVDNGFISFSLIFAGAIVAPFWPMYLWVALGNGFRYGVLSLVISTSAALVGFALATIHNPFWLSNPWQTCGQFIALVIIPAYVTSLLRQLHAAKSQAEAANQAKTRFIAVMSHELRTPLSAMVGSVGVLQNSALDEDQQHLVKVVSTSGQALLSMINELLDFSAIESGKTHFELRDVAIFDLLIGTTDTLTPAAEEKGLKLAVHVDCRLPPMIRTDSEHVRRIITNLVWNAIKFTPKGRIDVSIGRNRAGEGLLIEVQDTGVGISADKQSKVFEPFVQADSRVERAYEGVGLGLAIIRELVTMHRGRIALRSDVGIGSCFSVELPVTEPEDAAQPAEPAAGEWAMIVAGSGPLACGGLLEACDALGLGCSLADPDPRLLRGAIARGKPEARKVVFISHREMAIGGPTSHEQFESLARMIEEEDGVPVLVVAESDDPAILEPYRQAVSAMMIEPDQTQLANLLRLVAAIDSARKASSAVGQVAETAYRVLLVEDNATNRFITERALSDAGHQVRSVGSGDEALNALDQESFDAVILDVNMPGISGIETAKIIRTINYSEKLKVIGLTADVTSETNRQCRDAGMDLVLTKPASTPVLLKALDGLITRGVALLPTDKVTPIEASSRFRSRRAPVMDEAGFQRLMEIGDRQFLLESLTLFLAEAGDLIAALEQALADYDRGQAFDIFHSLRGICANVGASRMREVVNLLRNADDLMTERDKHVRRLRDELDAFQVEATQRVPDLEVIPLSYS